LRVGVVDRETRALQAVLEIERGAGEIHGALRVDDDCDLAVLLDHVVVGTLGVEVHLVAEALAAAAPHCHAQEQRGPDGRAVDQLLHLVGRVVSEGDHGSVLRGAVRERPGYPTWMSAWQGVWSYNGWKRSMFPPPVAPTTPSQMPRCRLQTSSG